ncbi:MAG: hypothetical protein MUC50_09035, partial [Myxococcota bacterium]|nr:hypothetical protein [Myxococcota bacterium]
MRTRRLGFVCGWALLMGLGCGDGSLTHNDAETETPNVTDDIDVTKPTASDDPTSIDTSETATENDTGSGVDTGTGKDTGSGVDTGTGKDTGSGVDTGTGKDTGSGVDTGTGNDTGSGVDTGTGNDTGSGVDTGTGNDTGSVVDTGTGNDTGSGVDTGTGNDTGSGVDTGTGNDTGSGVDTGTGNDTGSGVDTGTGNDTGSGVDTGTGEDTGTGTDIDCPLGIEDCPCTPQAQCDLGLVCNDGFCELRDIGSDTGEDTSADTDTETDSQTDTGEPVICDDGWTGPDCERCLVYVDQSTGNDGNDGRSWNTALSTVPRALLLAEYYGSCEVWVAQGTYYPTAGVGRTFSIEMISGIDLYGGFASGERLKEQRDWEAHVTILSGNIGNSKSNADNSYHVLIGAENAILDGFTVSDGNANGSAAKNETKGGGIVFNAKAPPIRNCVFKNNRSIVGGAIYSSSSVTVSDSTFTGNSASSTGGAIHSSSSVTV